MSEQLKDSAYYTNIVNISSPICGNIPVGKILTGEKWKELMVYPIGNCGINAMFQENGTTEVEIEQNS
jgi:hypothetical protein